MSNSKALRKNTVEMLALLVERYPNLPIGQILDNAVQDSMSYVTDEELARGLNQLFISFTQLEAAGIQKRG